MRAAVSTRYGPPEVVHVVDDAPEPEVAADDLLVRVHATTVNRTDSAYRRRVPVRHPRRFRLARPKVPVWGTEYAGVVERVGAAGDALRPRRPRLRLRRGSLRCPRRARRRGRVLVRGTGARRGRPAPRRSRDRGRPLRAERHPPRRHRVRATGSSCTARPVRSGRPRCSCSPTWASTSSRPRPRRTSSWCGGWVPVRVVDFEVEDFTAHRRDRRRRARPGRQEHLRCVPTHPRPRRRLHLERPRAVRAEHRPAAGHEGSAAVAGSSSRSR